MKAHLRKVKLLLLFTAALCINVTAQDSWTWTQRYNGPKHLNAVAASSDGLFAAVGTAGTILTSPNGVDWTERDSKTNFELHSVIWGDGMFVAGGDSGTIVTSEDGVKWVVRRSGGNGPIQSIVWGDGKYLAVTSNNFRVFTSYNGVGWTEQQGISGGIVYYEIISVAYGGGLFMIGNSDCYVPTSTDGINWEENPNKSRGPSISHFICYYCRMPGDPVCMPSCGFVYSMAYGNGVFLLLGEGLARYENGKDWEILDFSYNCEWQPPGLPTSKKGIDGHSIIYDGARFIIAGSNGIYFTKNGDEFEQVSTKSWWWPYDISDKKLFIAYNGDVYVTVNGTEIGTLSQGFVSVIKSNQGINSVSGLTVHQSGKMLKIIMPNQNVHSKIAIFNLAGKRQKSKPVFHTNGTVSLSLVSLATGTYVLRVNDGRKNWQSKIIVK